MNLDDLIAAAKEEGQLNTIALPPDWANYGEIMQTFAKKYGIQITNATPNGSSAEENQASSRSRADRARRTSLDVEPGVRGRGHGRGPVRQVLRCRLGRRSRTAMKDADGLLGGRLLGRGRDRRKHGRSSRTRRRRGRTCSSRSTRTRSRLNGSPLTSGSAFAGVFAAALANGGSLDNIAPGIDFFAELQERRQLHRRRRHARRRSRRARRRSRSTGTTCNSRTANEFPRPDHMGGARSRATAASANTTARRSTRPHRTRGRRACGRSSSTRTRASSCG